MGIELVTVRGRRAIGVMVVAAAALVLSGAAFLHAGAKPDRLPPTSSRVASAGLPALQPQGLGTIASGSQTVTLSEAEAEARRAGLPLMKPRWLPFRSRPSDGPQQVQEFRDPNGLVFSVITIYYGPDGQTLAITQQFQPAQLSLRDLEGTVGSSQVPWSRTGGDVSLAWKVSGGRYIIVQGTGLTEDELRRISDSLA